MCGALKPKERRTRQKPGRGEQLANIPQPWKPEAGAQGCTGKQPARRAIMLQSSSKSHVTCASTAC